MDNCIFCKIVKGDIPCFKIHEDDNYLAFLDISSLVEGHTLVIPKKHYRYFWEIDDVGEYYEFVSKVCNHYSKNLGFKYIDTFTLGRMVPHSHVHLIPHNDDSNDWKKGIEAICTMQEDESRRLTKERGEDIKEKFAF